MNTQDKIAVIGLGYVGFPLLMAITNSTNIDVVGYDVSKTKIDLIKRGLAPIVDPEAEELVKTSKPMKASMDESVLADKTVYIICVPTPVKTDHEPDYTIVESAAATIAKYLKKGDIVVLESTVNPGTCEEIMIPILEKYSPLKVGVDYDVAHCPERINPGDKKWNVTNIPRNIGATREAASNRLVNLYSQFIQAKITKVSTLKIAEASKIIENAFRDINIAYVNELAKSFDKLGIDLIETIHASSSKPFGFMPFWPGCGVGGHCIPVDPYYLIKRASLAGFNHRLLIEAREINNSMPEYTISKLIFMLNHMELAIKNVRIGLLGLSFKANVGDLRESPSLQILEILRRYEATVSTFDPFLPDKSSAKSLEELMGNSDIIILARDHRNFSVINSRFLSNYKIKGIVDGVNFLDKTDIESIGIKYTGIGR